MMATPDEVTGPINLGNPGEFTILELAEQVLEFTGSKSTLVIKPLPSDDPKQRQPDIMLAKEMLGWTPKVPLADGLIHTINYFEELLGHAQQPAFSVYHGETAVQSTAAQSIAG